MPSLPPSLRERRAQLAREHPKVYLAVHYLAGALATVLLVWLFLAIAEDIPEQSLLVRVDNFVTAWLLSHGTEPGETFEFYLSYLGAQVLFIAVAGTTALLAWRRERRDAIALAITSAGGVALSTVLKTVFHRGRPESAVEFITRHTWSFPSGHAMNSIIGYGFLTTLALERIEDRRKRIALIAATATIILAIGFSRLYLGVHYLSDVVGGWLAGAAWLIVCISAYRYPGRHATPPRYRGSARAS